MTRILTLALLLAVVFPFKEVAAQRIQAPIGVHYQFRPASSAIVGSVSVGGGGTPRWVKWGIVGAVAGGALFAFAGQQNTDQNHSMAGDFAYGAATGFVILGGGVALWDWLCAGDTKSRRSGLCGR